MTYFATDAFATLPLIADDTGTMGQGNFEFELFSGYCHDSEDGIKEQTTEVSSSLTCGVTNPIDLTVNVPRQYVRTRQDGSLTEDNGFSGEEQFDPAGRRIESPEEKAGHHIEWAVHCNAGCRRNDNTVKARKDIWSFSVAGSIEFIEDIYFVADLGAQTNSDRDDATHPVYFLAGAIYSPAETVDLAMGIKLGLNLAGPDYSLRGGIMFRL